MKTLKQIGKNLVNEDAPANSMGAGPQGLDSAKGEPIAGYDKLLMGRRMLRRKALDVLGKKK